MIKKVAFCAVLAAAPSLVLAAEDPAELSLEDLVKTDITSVSRKSQSLADVPAAAWDALAAAPRYASELGDAEPDPDELRDVVRLPRGKGLDQQLAADDWWDLSELLRGRIKPEDLARVRPWYAMSLVTSRVAPGPSPTMDEALTRRAAALHHPVDALETWHAQLATVADGKVSVAQQCQRCLGKFEAITDLDCLEWDDACKTEVGRFG